MRRMDVKKEIKSKPLRSTRQRAIILEVLKGTSLHPTADWIYHRVRRTRPNVSLGTIYRNLNLLKEKGLINELKFGKNTSRYDGKFSPHHHIFCIHCGKLEDVSCNLHADFNKSVEKTSGYKIVAHQLEFNGICPDCLKTEKKKRSAAE